MKWKKYTIHTSEEAEDPVSAILGEAGISGIEIEDKKPVTREENGGYFGDVVPAMPEDDHLSAISFYLSEDDDPQPVLAHVRSSLKDLADVMDIGPGTITEGSTDEEDWINNWKQYFHGFFIDDIYIEPTWEEGSQEEKAASGKASMVLHIDPGTAFGTGKHESTQLAVRALRKYIKNGDEILDIGTGSGILGIVALKEGAEHVFGTDLDDNTLPAIEDNLRENGIRESQFTRRLGNIADDEDTQNAVGYSRYNIVLANIIAEILETITPAVPPTLVDGGIYITSGILQERENIVLDAGRRAGFEVLEINHMGDWSCIVFSYRKRQ